jgi:hypothetical protein
MATSIHELNTRAMSLLRGGGTEPEWAPVGGHTDLVSIPQDDAEEMVDVLAVRARDYVVTGEIEEEAARALSMGLGLVTGREAATQEALAEAERVARFGYMARVAEWELLASARRLEGWMIASLRGAVESSVAEELGEAHGRQAFYDALSEVTAFFVRREPLDVSYDTDEGFALMWTIPGMGGEIRAWLREKSLAMALDRAAAAPASGAHGVVVEDLQRVWKYGFVLRSFEEFFWED